MNMKMVSNKESEISIVVEDRTIIVDVNKESIDLSELVEILSSTNQQITFDFSNIEKLIDTNVRSEVFKIVFSYVKELAKTHSELVKEIENENQ